MLKIRYSCWTMFGYIDESGAPGLATSNNDYLVVSLIIFNTEQTRNDSLEKIEELRKKLRLPEEYEFHCSSNSTRVQEAFVEIIAKLEFRFITIAIHKTKRRADTTYARMSKLLIDAITENFKEIKIEMDSNPTLYAEMRKRIRESKNNNIKLRQRNSRHSRMIQVADYVVNISSKKVKKVINADKWYRVIKRKTIRIIVIEN